MEKMDGENPQLLEKNKEENEVNQANDRSTIQQQHLSKCLLHI
jgi:hypothetical protein